MPSFLQSVDDAFLALTEIHLQHKWVLIHVSRFDLRFGNSDRSGRWLSQSFNVTSSNISSKVHRQCREPSPGIVLVFNRSMYTFLLHQSSLTARVPFAVAPGLIRLPNSAGDSPANIPACGTQHVSLVLPRELYY